jgi:hypothetical protein
MNENRMVIEVNGVKLDVDLRTARRIDTLQVGSRVKVLTKPTYENTWKVRPGIVAGFEPFQKLPTIVVAVLDIAWDSAKLDFIVYNADSKDVEIIAAVDNDELEVNRGDVNARFDREIATKEKEIDDLRRRRAWFEQNFAAYFVQPEKARA